VSGPLGVLGALGPLGVALQFGMSTSSDGVYKTVGSKSEVSDAPCSNDGEFIAVRTSLPLRYTYHGASTDEYRQYGLYEMYSRQHALAMTSQDTSFGVDASTVLAEEGVPSSGSGNGSGSGCSVSDTYVFSSGGADQHLQVNAVPYGGSLSAGKDKMEWDGGVALHLTLSCRRETTAATAAAINRTAPTTSQEEELFTISAQSTVEPYVEWKKPYQQVQSSLMPFLYARLRPGEQCSVTVNASLPVETCPQQGGADGKAWWTGYYLFVTGSAVSQQRVDKENLNPSGSSIDDNPDLWGPRVQQDGSLAFNVYGTHQRWIANNLLG
jgi:hypothetical protein